MSHPTTKNWVAWYNTMPGTPPTVHVIGQVTVPTAGYSVRLVRHVPPGFNPAILVLELVVVPPTGMAAQVVTTIRVHFQEQTATHYSHVTILPENVTIPVENVS